MSTSSMCKMCYRQREAPFFVSRKKYDVAETCMSCRCKSSTKRDMKVNNDGRSLPMRTQDYFDGFSTDAASIYGATPKYADVVKALNDSKLEVMLYLATRDTLMNSSRVPAVTDGTARSVKRDLRSKGKKQDRDESSMLPSKNKEDKRAATGRHDDALSVGPSASPSEFIEPYTAIKVPEDPDEDSTAFDGASAPHLKRKSPYFASNGASGSAETEDTYDSERNSRSKKPKLEVVAQQVIQQEMSPGKIDETEPLLAKRKRTPAANLSDALKHRPAKMASVVLKLRPSGQAPAALDVFQPRQLRSRSKPRPSENLELSTILKTRPKKTSPLTEVTGVDETDGGEALARQQFLDAVAAQEQYDVAYILLDFAKEWAVDVTASGGEEEGGGIPRGWKRTD